MDGSDGGVCESSSGDGGADGLNVGVGVLEVSGDVKGQGVGDGVDFEEKKLVEDNSEVIEADVLNGGQARVSGGMEVWVAGAVRALDRDESVEGGGNGGETNGNVFDVENRGFREADTRKRSLVEDDDENKSLVEDDTEKKKLNEDELDERKNLTDNENERVVQGETEMKKSDEDENQESFEDLVDNERLVEDDHGNNLSTELDDDDDWEGIERTELEKRFGAAVAYVGRDENEECLSKLSSIVKVQLYGLHKVATQGPCAESQPSIFQVSARSNWNAWRQMGDMSPEEAMEKYIALLSESVNNWMEDDIAGTSTD
uniref:ACB domain-containing protein n=1 Tax=Kalanchoe fedtschenkoi TaxID=63787 RepID=A0A7N0T530_KALFE